MKYLVVECGLSYAVVLDEEGRFLKVANLHYQVGQTVTDVIEMRLPDASREAPSQIHYGSRSRCRSHPMSGLPASLWFLNRLPGPHSPSPKRMGKSTDSGHGCTH